LQSLAGKSTSDPGEYDRTNALQNSVCNEAIVAVSACEGEGAVDGEGHGPLRCRLTSAHCALCARGEAPASKECNDFIDDLFWKACLKKMDCSEFSYRL
jgi:hypothetical protein